MIKFSQIKSCKLLIFSSLYTNVFLCTNSFLRSQIHLDCFQKFRIVNSVSWSNDSILPLLKTSCKMFHIMLLKMIYKPCNTEIIVTDNYLVSIKTLPTSSATCASLNERAKSLTPTTTVPIPTFTLV